MRAVMISIHHKWCELIASGRKTIEVRKTKPKLDAPFKVYIYCTQEKGFASVLKNNERADGKVIGEFVCDEIIKYDIDVDGGCLWCEAQDCLSGDEFEAYIENVNVIYGWHISNLLIYDKPKELSDFAYAGICPYNSKNGCGYKLHCFRAGEQGKGAHGRCGEYLSRPPQSWMYVEELK